jgi:hypothetical protein
VPDGWSHGGSGREKTEAEGADAIDHAQIRLKSYRVPMGCRICQWKMTEVKKLVTKRPEQSRQTISLIVYQAIQLLFFLSFLPSLAPFSYLLAFCSLIPS